MAHVVEILPLCEPLLDFFPERFGHRFRGGQLHERPQIRHHAEEFIGIGGQIPGSRPEPIGVLRIQG